LPGSVKLAWNAIGRPCTCSSSEVAVAVEAYEELLAQGLNVRVISLPSWALFSEQDQSYRDLVLPPDILARVAVEQASALGWERWVGTQGTIIAMRSFGASGPGRDVRRYFGFTAGAVAKPSGRPYSIASASTASNFLLRPRCTVPGLRECGPA